MSDVAPTPAEVEEYRRRHLPAPTPWAPQPGVGSYDNPIDWRGRMRADRETADRYAPRRQERKRKRRRMLLLAAVLACGLPVLAFLMLMMTLAGNLNLSGPGGANFRPSPEALADIPGDYLRLYLQAGRDRGLDWAVLAGIGSVETNHGRLSAPGVRSGVNAYGCCAGPMQFSVTGAGGGTWGAYGVDGNHDGSAPNVYDPVDAIPAAADLLKANGAPGDYRRAIFAYNHADWYVSDVLAKASEYRGAMAGAGGGLGGLPGQLLVNEQAAVDVLALADGSRPRITLNAIQRNDLRTGQIDPRVSSLLAVIGRAHTVTVTALKGDHSLYTTGGRVSNHSEGRAADIGVVDGERCDSDAHGRTGRCWQLARELAAATGPLHPSELIYGIDPDGPSGPAFAAADHKDHIHMGYDAR